MVLHQLNKNNMEELIESELVVISGGGCDTSFGYDAGRFLRFAVLSFCASGVALADYKCTSKMLEFIC
jgi:hypothetical protein